ncbi:hypothetical protein BDP55DRAFT_626787 [Colletotrichum godetiae]|uniref:Uncharacterized protein n=1 Tax=Colletotrichum godetiae TaxID=1209918 RepID=A0AAJ0AXI4_9PEZI|nr:uncharacterized protein BDP55DRAFT_626787 [Colletotrichum godetiae]KAK1700135.1 hypothetical protein BDP55DRAFT_626787 [Colletotrichum godetiae]
MDSFILILPIISKKHDQRPFNTDLRFQVSRNFKDATKIRRSPSCSEVVPEALYWNPLSLLFHTNLNHGLISRLTAAPEAGGVTRSGGTDLPPPLAFTNEGSRKRKGLRHYENAVTPPGVPIPLVGGIPAVRRNSPRFKHIGPRCRSDGDQCSPFDVRTLDAAAPEARADTSNCKVMVVVFPRTVRPFGAWGAFSAQKPCAKKRGSKLPDETDVVRWHCYCRNESPSLLPNSPDELLEPPCSWHDEYGVNPGEAYLEEIIGYRSTHHQPPLVTGSRLSPESYQDGFHERQKIPFFTEHDGSPIIEDIRKSPLLSIEFSPSSSDKPLASPGEDNAQPKYLSLTHDHHHVSQAQAPETPNDHNYGEPMPGNWQDLASETDSPSAEAEYPCTSEAVGTYAPPATDSNLAGSHRKSKTEFNSIPPKLAYMDTVPASGPDAGTQVHRKSSTEFKEVVATGGR